MKDQFSIGELIIDQLEKGKQSASIDPQLDEWQNASLENKNDLEKYRRIWNATEIASTFQKFDAGKAWNQMHAKFDRQNVRVKQLKTLVLVTSAIAASLLIFIGFTFYTDLFSEPGKTIALSTTYGSRSEVVLPDGSHVKLNAGSRIEYHYDKLRKTRQVDFSGEAFFEVAKSRRPFVIQTPEGLKVKVLGTKFNLRSYPEDNQAQTSLIDGTVELKKSGLNTLTLNPGQTAVFDKKAGKLNYIQGDVSQSLGWMQNKLYMDNMSLHEVSTRLQRWYDVQISFSDKSLGEKIHYTGVLQEQTVLDVLNALCRLSSIKYELKGKKIIISEK